MLCKLICVFLALVIASSTEYIVTDFITGSDPEVTVDHLRTQNPETSTIEGVEEVTESSATDLGMLLDAGDGIVVTLVAGDTHLAAHKAVLTARSPVFRAMVLASNGEVAVPEVEGPVLRQLVAYLYTQQAPHLPGMATELLVAADRYGMPSLKAACERQVAQQLSVENAAAAAVLALKHSCPGLRKAAIAFIKAHTYQVMRTRGWADALVGDPHSLVELTILIAESPAETSTPATTDVSTPRQPNTSVSHAPPVASCHTPPPDDAAVFLFRSLSGQEKGDRLIEAAKLGAMDKLQALLAAGADVGARDEGYSTAMHWAAHVGQVKLVECLLEAGAEVDARNNEESTPLFWAAESGHTAVVRLLMSACADPNAKNQYQNTPLHIAVENGHTETAAALFEAGANVWAKNTYGETPRHLAIQRNLQQLVDLFARRSHRCKHQE